ncbi:PepSY-associated TM helix domain-containing protein [Solimicrobium silvestre]|uniref:PepSY-associated TM helix domain-containing protein n=1 Tax=Solimicrobium silvestre TaxID=2099400 RepID=UPI000CFCD56C|nr:PepSY-associated TM helix domain-containing protein [Solimicrobium silvestre]
MRPLFVILHRWFGLAAALFLFIAGATGAFISWDHELDAWLNPQLFKAHSAKQLPGMEALPGLALANQVEAQDKRLRVTYVLTESDAAHTSMMMVEGRTDPATKRPFALGFNQIAVDPVTAEIQGKRMWGALSLDRENLLPFLYKLHYTMFLPDVGGIELGIWLMGIIGVIWAFDCFIALWLSFPNWRSWRKSFVFRWQQGGHKLNFDVHRSGGVWLWILLLILAVTSVSMNLERPLIRPIIQFFSPLTPDIFDSRKPLAPEHTVEASFSREQVVELAADEGRRRGWSLPVGGIFYSSEFGVYGVGFFNAGNDHGDIGLGNTWLYFDADNGQLAGSKIPGTGSAGDLFLQAQFPLHSGRILGLTGRILISIMGIAVALLSATGVIIWARKRRARLLSARQRVN